MSWGCARGASTKTGGLRSALAALVLAGLATLSGAQSTSTSTPTPAPAPAATTEPQRLALVLGIGQVAQRPVLDSARRDAQAVAAALKAGGFEVLLREDVDSTALRAAVAEFRQRLKPDTVGLVYYTGLAAQVDGRNLLLPTDVALNDSQTASAVAALLRAVGVPLQELADALAGGTDVPRVLVVDAAYRHPTLARLVPPGLARPRLAPGVMALLGHAPAALQDPPVVSAPEASADPRDAAATRFARVLVETLTTPRITLPEALRAARLATVDLSRSRTQPWVGGDTASRVFLASATRLEAPATAAASAPASAVAAAGVTPLVTAPAPAAAPPVAAASAPAAAASAAPRPATDGRTARAPGQGERPVFQARSNSFGHAEGDTLSYQLLDTRLDEVLQSYTVTVDRVLDDGQLQGNGGAWLLDAQGRVRSQRAEDGTVTRHEPEQAWWWARPQAGESRAVAFTETVQRPDGVTLQTAWKGTAQVGAQRMLESLVGDLEVLPIKTTGEGRRRVGAADGPVETLAFARTVWYSPKLGLPVAVDIEDTDAQGKPLRRERLELTHAQQLRTAN